MPHTFNDRLSQLFREIEIDLGTTELCTLTLEALYDALKDVKSNDLHHFYSQLKELTLDVQATQPKYAIIIDSFFKLLRYVYAQDHKHPEHFQVPKKIFLKYLKELIKEKNRRRQEIIKISEKIKLNGKTILIYNHSGTLEHVLLHAKNKKQKFKIIVAEQDFDKTGRIIEFLHANSIPYKVVPSYMVSHLDENIDMLFFGALTLKSTIDFVMDTGANAIIAQFHLKKKPIYVFLTTGKFSLWKAEKRTEIFTHSKNRSHHTKSIDFEHIKFSHDRVDVNLVTKIITEEGIFHPDEIKKVFNEKLKKRLDFEKKMKT
ncbi:MAG: hypothetical protein Q8P68_00320 [Candidatus Peregrinibacteria bacterium]|nr:hypothetical protein [Candidatus Peregrinibacteria bacterium]MDZ4244926.1 hypothetical protein [Candidatus Gracilibacteria bacterium]